MANIEESLRRKLYRAFCPESMDLDDYLTGELSQKRKTMIRDHLNSCPRCRREIEQMQAFIRETRPNLELSLVERVRVLVARLAKSSDITGLSPAVQSVRGYEGQVLTYEADGLKVILDVQIDPERADLKAIYGVLVGAENAQEFRAQLLQEVNPFRSIALDPFGNFEFLSIVPGEYQVVLIGPGIEIRIEDLAT